MKAPHPARRSPPPASRAAVVFSLAAFLLSFPAALTAHGWTERDVPVPMRDGVVLRANVLRPAAPGEYPVLLLRTPYGKDIWTAGKMGEYKRFAEAGYIVVAQDARGRYRSDGEWESFLRPDDQTHDAEDGYDTVQWAATKLRGSNGKVATFGPSYMAFAQWRLAPLNPPALGAMAAFTIPARYTDLEGPGTIRPWRRLNFWAVTMAPEMRRRAKAPGTHDSGQAAAAWDAGEGRSLLTFLPWAELPGRVFEHEGPAVREWLKNPAVDPWQLDKGVPEITVPNLDVTGWYDHCNGTIDLYTAMAARAKTEKARKGSKIVIGPWNHVSLGQRATAGVDFGPNAQMDLTALQIRWFDRWLKGKDNGIDREPPVRVFTMGTNRWQDFDHWPPRDAAPRELFLTSGGKANTPRGDGKLAAAAGAAGRDGYRYDPRDPVPSLLGGSPFTVPADVRPLAHRQDVLAYQTEPLKEPLEVTGYPEAVLYAASSAPDTDFFARLIDVSPDGTARDVASGMVRTRYREGLDKPKLLEPGATTKLQIRMGPTSVEFKPGHRIRLDVTSSDFPNYDRNHNTAADQNADAQLVPADQTLHHGGEAASKLILPARPTIPAAAAKQ